MKECSTDFAFGLTENEFVILCFAIAGFVVAFCAMVSYLNGPRR